jgi:Domain of unknown function (DUF4265)
MNINLRFDNPGDVTVEFPTERASMSLSMERVSSDIYRVRSVPFISESVSFGDLVRVEELEDGTLRVLKVVERANWQVFECALPKVLANAPQTLRFCKSVEDAGGYWEQVFGGMLIVCLPPESAFQAETELELLCAAEA